MSGKPSEGENMEDPTWASFTGLQLILVDTSKHKHGKDEKEIKH